MQQFHYNVKGKGNFRGDSVGFVNELLADKLPVVVRWIDMFETATN